MDGPQTVIAIWFVVSVIVTVSGKCALYVWLRRQNAPFLFSLSGVPGYLDQVYVKWCRERGRSPSKVLWFRVVSLVSVVVSSIAFVTMVALP